MDDLGLQAFGLGLSITTDRSIPGLMPAIERRLGTTHGPIIETMMVSVASETQRPGFWTVSVGNERPVGHADDVDELASFITDLFHLELFDFCQRRDPPLLMIHAGVVAVDGMAVVIPGASMSGKSSLVAALVQCGASYLSDEYAALDAEGSVWPYPRPIALRTIGGTERPTPAAERPASTALGPTPVALIVDTHFEPDADWAPTTVRGAAAILPLLAQSGGVRDDPGQTLALAASLAEVPLLRGPRGDATETATRLLRLVPNLPMANA